MEDVYYTLTLTSNNVGVVDKKDLKGGIKRINNSTGYFRNFRLNCNFDVLCSLFSLVGGETRESGKFVD